MEINVSSLSVTRSSAGFMLRRYMEVLLMTTGPQIACVRLAVSVCDANAFIKADGCTQDVVC